MNSQFTTSPQSSNPPIGKCALCDTENIALHESHSIPKFVYQWIKETSVTPYFRSADNVNVREQDGPKEHLLCGTCEGELSLLEKEFAENIFKKIANYRQQAKEIEITEGMRVTVLSIFWRALLTTQHRENNRTAEDNVVLEQFLSSAKRQVKERAVTMPIHITPFIGDPPLYGFPTELTYLLHRMVGNQDICFFDDPHRYYAVFKLPFMFFHIRSPEWGANLDPESSFSGRLKLDKIKHLPNFLEDHIYKLANEFNQSLQKLTQQSIEVIERDLVKGDKITGAHKSMAASLQKK